MTQKSIIINKTYRLVNKIGEGSFGKIFAAKHKDENIGKYAIKLIETIHQDTFTNELNIYERLKDLNHIPSLYAAGSEGKYNYIVMDLLEQNLEQLRTSYADQMNLKTVIHLGLQMLTIIESIHQKGIIHRDIKPANFLLKANSLSGISELYLIDFGLACCFVDDTKHIQMKTNERLIGTPRYMSVNMQQGVTASRRDDLESLGYILIFLQKGELPWQSSGEMAPAIKQTFGWAYANNIAGEFILFNHYCRALPFHSKPSYEYLRNLLTNLATISV